MLARIYSTSTRCLLLSLALVLLQPGLALAQNPAPLQASPSAANPALDDPMESAVEHLPSAPMYIAEASSELAPPANPASMPPVAFAPVTAQPEMPVPHRFWDRENRLLIATVGAFAAADFCVTRANLASGGRELNPVTRVLSGSTPGLAANFALETGGVMAISYVFHRTGHHKLERVTSLVSIGTSASAVGYDLAHR
jgi:hypothetical protein